jgi:hypothetical protein
LPLFWHINTENKKSEIGTRLLNLFCTFSSSCTTFKIWANTIVTLVRQTAALAALASHRDTSNNSGGDLAHSLKCLTTGLVVHHVASNSTHFSQLYDRVVFLIAKMLSIKELSVRIQAMQSRRPECAVSRAAWCLRIMRTCVLSMNQFDNSDCTLQQARNAFMAGFQNNNQAEVAALDVKLNDIFDMAERRQVDEILLLSAIAPAMFVALQPKYVVQSAKMVGLLPPDFVLGRDDYMRAGVWPDHVMKNPLVQLQLQRRQNEINFANNQETAIREVLASVGLESDQQILSSAPPMSHAGERAALEAANDDVWSAFKRSRNLELDEDTSAKFQALVGDFQIFSKQVAREEARSSALSNFIGFNSRTAAACSALLNQQKQEQTTTFIAATERLFRIGTSKFNSMLVRANTGARHLNLWRMSDNKEYPARNIRSCCTTARLEHEAGCINHHQVEQYLAYLTWFDGTSKAAIEDLRMDFCTLRTLKASATACLRTLLQLEVRCATN